MEAEDFRWDLYQGTKQRLLKSVGNRVRGKGVDIQWQRGIIYDGDELNGALVRDVMLACVDELQQSQVRKGMDKI